MLQLGLCKRLQVKFHILCVSVIFTEMTHQNHKSELPGHFGLKIGTVPQNTGQVAILLSNLLKVTPEP